MAKALALPPPMDYAPVDGYDDLGFFGSLVSPEMLKTSVVAAGGGAIGGVAFTQLCKVEMGKEKKKVFDKPWKKGLFAGVFGLVGARALWGDPESNAMEFETRRDLAKGHLGAMGSALGNIIVDALMSKDKKTDEPGDTAKDGYFPRSKMAGYFADPQVETEPSFADVDVETDNPLGADVSTWIS